MRFVTKDTDYALRALIFMARELRKGNKESIVSVERIVRKEHLPRALLRCVLQKLADEGILRSYKGKGGGFLFQKSPDRITIATVMDIFQGPFDLTHCFMRTELCPNTARCTIRKKIKAISARVNGELKSITISSLV